ncbi:hypothetical protein PAAL109150_12135 [Paenibacillus alkaliterrae]
MMDADHLDETLNYAWQQGWITNRGIFNSLMAKVDPIQRNQDDSRQVLNGLNALEHEVRALSGKKISAAFAELLLSQVLYLNNMYK